MNCQQCGVIITDGKRKKFCSRQCQQRFDSHKHYILNREKIIQRTIEYHKNSFKYKLQQKEYRNSPEHKKYMKEYCKKWANTIEGRGALREAKRRYDKTEKGREVTKKYHQSEKWKSYAKNFRNSQGYKDYIKEYKKKWVKSEKGKQSIKKAESKFHKTFKGKVLNSLKCSKRRLRRKQLEERFTREEWVEKLKATNGFCPKCNKYVGIDKLTLDHIIPISLRIKTIYYINDIQPLCKSCNSSKRDKLEIENNFYE
jgi:hypothetical protein